jgi:hypothetical protein
MTNFMEHSKHSTTELTNFFLIVEIFSNSVVLLIMFHDEYRLISNGFC